MNHTAALTEALGRPGAVITDHDLLSTACTDWRGWFLGSAAALLRPRTVDEVRSVVRCCAARGLSIVPQAGNSSMVGGSVPPADGAGSFVVLSLSGLDRIRSVEPGAWALTAEAGCTLRSLQRAAAAADRSFGVDLGARDTARLGGLVATNAGGMGVLRYGTMREQVLGIEAVLPDGRLWDGLRSLRKDNSGYDLKHLLIGSEGTLGIVTAATLRLHPPERHGATVLLALPGLDTVNSATERLLRAGSVSALELMPAMGISLACEYVVRCRPPMEMASAWYLQVRFAGPDAVTALAEDAAAALLAANLAVDAVVAASAKQEAQLWEIRDAFSAMHRHLGRSVRFDLSVPLGRIPALIAELKAVVTRIAPNARAFAFGHLGDGNLHFSVCQPETADAEAFRTLEPGIHAAVNEICWAHGGSISAEHGIGRLHRDELLRQKPAIELQLQRRIKTALDPQGLLNPGILLPNEPPIPGGVIDGPRRS